MAAKQQSGGADSEVKGKKATIRRARTLAETRSWYADRFQSVTVQRNFLFVFVAILMVGLGLSVMMIASLTNSKTFEPFVVEIEEKTGIITQVSAQSIERYAAEESLVRSHLVQYLRAREGYEFETYRYNYSQLVRLFSAPGVYGEFTKIYSASNKDSPVNLGRSARRTVLIKSLTFLDGTRKKVQARLRLTDISLPDMKEVKGKDLVIIITFDFKGLDLSLEERYINPLGFQIQSYVSEEEAGDVDSKN